MRDTDFIKKLKKMMLESEVHEKQEVPDDAKEFLKALEKFFTSGKIKAVVVSGLYEGDADDEHAKGFSGVIGKGRDIKTIVQSLLDEKQLQDLFHDVARERALGVLDRLIGEKSGRSGHRKCESCGEYHD